MEASGVADRNWELRIEPLVRSDECLNSQFPILTRGEILSLRKGATIPTGETGFQFHTANLDFHSISYEWLVVAGARAQYKSSGIFEGMNGIFGFMLTAIDGQVNGGGGTDKFRIKIWDAGGTIVYDNQLGSNDDGDPTTILGGGSIVVHK